MGKKIINDKLLAISHYWKKINKYIPHVILFIGTLFYISYIYVYIIFKDSLSNAIGAATGGGVAVFILFGIGSFLIGFVSCLVIAIIKRSLKLFLLFCLVPIIILLYSLTSLTS